MLDLLPSPPDLHAYEYAMVDLSLLGIHHFYDGHASSFQYESCIIGGLKHYRSVLKRARGLVNRINSVYEKVAPLAGTAIVLRFMVDRVLPIVDERAN